MRVRDAGHPVSRGYTCSKGRALGAFHHDPDRLDDPLVDGAVTPWNVALDDLGARLADVIAEHGGGLGRRVPRHRARVRRQRLDDDRPAVLDVADAPALHAGHDRQRTGAARRRAGQRHATPEPGLGSGTLTPAARDRLQPGRVARVRHHARRPGRAPARLPVGRRRDLGARPAALRDRRRSPITTSRRCPAPTTSILACLVRELLADGADRTELEQHARPADVERGSPPRSSRSRSTAWPPAPASMRPRSTGLLAAVRAAGRIAVMAGTGITMSRGGIVTEWLRWALLVVTGSLDREGGMRCNPGYLFPAEGHRFPAPPEGDAAVPAPDGPASRPDLPRWLGQLPCAGMADEIAAGNLRALVIVGGNPLTAFPDAHRTRGSAGVARRARGRRRRPQRPDRDRDARAPGRRAARAGRPADARAVHVRQRDPVHRRGRRPGRPPPADMVGRWRSSGAGSISTCSAAASTPTPATTPPCSPGWPRRAAAAPTRSWPPGPRGIVMPSVYGWVHDALADGCWRVAPEPLVELLAGARRGRASADRADPPPRDAGDELRPLHG